jgi:chemotaxis protein methyltransferase CheR
MIDAERTIRIGDDDFEWFRSYFGRRTGIYFEEHKRYFVDRRLEARVRETGHDSVRQYFAFVQFQPSQDEFQRLVNVMTTNETYFYREDYQLHALTGTVLDEVVRRKQPGQPIRIWSMPCSTGEEPYSIAIHLLDAWPRMEDVDVEIIGSDINSDVLAACRRGVYSERAIRNVPERLLRRYFTRLREGEYAVAQELRDAITFTQVNITCPEETRGYRGFDVVFCRNMLIYFSGATQRDAVETIYGALNPGGFIFLGHSESMSRISSLFKVVKASSSLIYQRPL